AAATVEFQPAGTLRVGVGAQPGLAPHGRTVHRDPHPAFGYEADAAVAAQVDHAQVIRPDRQTDAVVGVTAHEVRARGDPVQADQAGPALFGQQVGAALFTPLLLVLLEGHL